MSPFFFLAPKTAAPAAAAASAGGARGGAASGGANSAEAETLREKVAELTRKLAEKDGEIARKLNEKDQEMARRLSEKDSQQESAHEKLQAQLRALQGDNDMLRADVNAARADLAKSSGAGDQVRRLNDEINRLKAAMVDNAKNVDLWKTQLADYERENKLLHEKVNALNEAQTAMAQLLSQR